MPKTSKNKANTAPSPKGMKWKWQPGSPVVVSNGSKMREMTLDIVATRVNGVYMGFCTKSWANDEAAYVFPFEKAHVPTSDVLACNTNVTLGDASHTFYTTLYKSKDTQREDKMAYHRVHASS